MDENEMTMLGLPLPGSAPAFRPQESGFRAASSRARRRQAGRSSVMAAVVVAAPVIWISALPAEQQQDSLRVAQSPTTVEPNESSEPSPTRSDEPTASPSLTHAEAYGAQTPVPDQPTAPPAPTAGPIATADPRPNYIEQPREVPGHDCGNVEDAASNFGVSGACVRSQGPGTLRAGQPAVFVLSFCKNAVTTEAAQFPFGTGQEHEMTVRDRADDEDGFPTDNGALRWRFGSTVRFVEGAHQRSLEPNRCLEWRTAWDGRAADGSLLPPGDYEIRIWITESSGYWSAPAGQRLTLTE